VIAEYGVKTLEKKKWAIVHSTDAFGTGGMKALVDSLDKDGIKADLVQGYANQAPDFTPVVLAVKQSGADVIGSYFTFENDLAVFARQAKQLGVNIPWIGSPSIVATPALNLGGATLYGTYGVADFNADSSPEAKAFAAKYTELFKARPDNFGAWTFDAVNVLARGIKDAGGADPEKLRSAIIAIKGMKGAEGEYNFDENGDGLHGYNIVRNEKGTIVFDRHIEFAS
jgi:branched-chain amino acid transport system substrate-binding protein